MTVAMVETLPPLTLLAGHLAPASLVAYGRDLAAYARFCAAGLVPLEAASLWAWRTALAQHTRVSPHTINRRLAAVKRLVAEAALPPVAPALPPGRCAACVRRRRRRA